MLNIAFNSKILCVLLILCGFSSTVLSSIDDKDELNPSVHVPYKFIKPVDLQQTDYNTTCDYRSQNWGMHLMTSCTQEADCTEACQGLSYLISYPGVLPEYLDDSISKKMTLITLNNFKFYYYSHNDNYRLCSLYIYYLNRQMDISMDTFRLKYNIDSNFNRGSLKDTARQIFDFRRNHISNIDSDIIHCPTVPAPENIKSIDDLAQFMMAKNHVFHIDDDIDNDDVGEFNRF